MLEPSIQEEIQAVLAEPDVAAKLRSAAALVRRKDAVRADRDSGEAPPALRPARPASWKVLPAMETPERPDLGTAAGRFQLVHAVAHIEVSAVELALMAVADFPDEEADYHRDMLAIAGEEVVHAGLLLRRLEELGGRLGDEPVHLALWETAHRHRTLVERLAVVPRILEAKGLDVSHRLRGRLRGAGDAASAQVLERVYQDEIGHVAVGTRWYRRACRRRGLDPEAHFLEFFEQFRSNRPVPFDVEGRRRAGFTDRELRGILGRPLPGR
jgi:uncharacterized ferritin-like protein (DUF455 family)